MKDGHLDLLAQDAVRAGEGSPEERAHAESCAPCRALIEGFRGLALRLAPPPFGVPEERSRRILAKSRERRSWKPLAASAAILLAAAAILLAVGLGVLFRPERARRPNIVDAYRVALRLRAGEPVEARWDLNGDGKVDEADVLEIARRSVSLR